jgi:ketosteroid isomerase-like protein
MGTDMTPEGLLRRTYVAFNARDLDAALAVMHPSVEWPNGMEGGMVHGHRGIREYWNRQWGMVNPHVEPMRFVTEGDGRIDVHVHQLVRDLAGNVLMDKFVQHVYHFEDGLIRSMEIRDA